QNSSGNQQAVLLKCHSKIFTVVVKLALRCSVDFYKLQFRPSLTAISTRESPRPTTQLSLFQCGGSSCSFLETNPHSALRRSTAFSSAELSPITFGVTDTWQGKKSFCQSGLQGGSDE